MTAAVPCKRRMMTTEITSDANEAISSIIAIGIFNV
jgi:hypothetical protein